VSGTAGVPAGTIRRRRPWTLRRRLVVTVVLLLAATAGALAVTSTLALRASLVSQLDTELLAASQRSAGAPRDEVGDDHHSGDPGAEAAAPSTGTGERDEEGPPPPFLVVAGQRTGTVGLLSDDGAVVQSGFLDPDARVQAIDTEQEGILLRVPVGADPQTVDLPGLGEFRVVARASAGQEVLVTGLSLAEVRVTERDYLTVVALVTALGLLAAATAAALVVRRSLRPLDRMAAAATRVAELPLDRGEVSLGERVADTDTDPSTEIGQVGAAFNHMLGNVESALEARHASELQVRQFVADASHELRTPLASIRGYAELVRRSPDDVPASTLRALDRVESETVRMTALVEDLLLLARLDAGRPLEREEVDVASLAVDALTDAHAAGPDHDWRLDLPDGPVAVVGDAARLHQVLTKLLANARVHTPPGTRVELRVSRPGTSDAGRQVRIEVHDDGPGIPASVLPTLFQRFTRGDDARNRTGGSTGLGLAIAHAVVTAHHGTIAVESRPGATTFSVTLPAASAPAPAPPSRPPSAATTTRAR
jgi:two-component system OmpR family sensor kinase